MAPPYQVCFHHTSSSSEVPLSLPEPASVERFAAAHAGRRKARQSTSVSSGTTAHPFFLRRVSAPG
eukprot:4590084-Pyramimonas_sp.AAC.1